MKRVARDMVEPKDVRILEIEQHGKTLYVVWFNTTWESRRRSIFMQEKKLKDMSKGDLQAHIAKYETADLMKHLYGRKVTDIVKIGDNIYPIQVDMPVDQNEQRPRSKENLPFRRRHRKRFRNEPEGLSERDFEGQEGERNQFKGMGTDQSYSIPGQGPGGAALGY